MNKTAHEPLSSSYFVIFCFCVDKKQSKAKPSQAKVPSLLLDHLWWIHISVSFQLLIISHRYAILWRSSDGLPSVHYIKENLRELTTWLFFVAGFQRKKERKKVGVFWCSHAYCLLKARSIIQWSNLGCRVVLGFLFLFFFDSSGYGQGVKKQIGSILWYEIFLQFFVPKNWKF
jgi:hypothetical protein